MTALAFATILLEVASMAIKKIEGGKEVTVAEMEASIAKLKGDIQAVRDETDALMHAAKEPVEDDGMDGDDEP